MHVVSVGFAAVKGTRHLARPAVRLSAAGAVGDRSLCLIDDAGQVLRTVAHPGLLRVVVTAADLAQVEPTGERLVADYWSRSAPVEVVRHPSLPARLASAAGVSAASVRLARPDPAAVVWGRGVSLVGTASLRDLAARVAPGPDGRGVGAGGSGVGSGDWGVDPARFRATVVVHTDQAYVEDTWCGQLLRVGDSVLRVGSVMPRCAVIDLNPVDGQRNSRLLDLLARYRPSPDGPLFGVDAEVVEAGTVRPGDEVSTVR